MLFRLSLAIDLPFSEIDCCKFVEKKTGLLNKSTKIDVEVQSNVTFWEIKQRAYFFGQREVTRRIDVRDAILDSASLIYAKKEDGKEIEDSFKYDQLSIVFDVDKPRARYHEARKELAKQKRHGK